ncbi:Putative phage tail protein [Sphingobium faniae]|nr:Putative phage tail protein [Sphingobium faniae]
MSKALRTAAMVVGAVALVAATAGLAAPAVAATATTAASAGGIAGISAATLTAIGTYGSLAAGVLSVAAQATAPGYSVEGNPTTFTTNPQSGLPYAIGRTRMSGLRIYAKTYDGFKIQSKDDILAFIALLSIAGPIHSIEKFTADNEVVSFAADGNASGRFHDYMGQKLSLGPSSGSALALSFGGKTFPGWTANHKLSGIAHAQMAFRFDTKGDFYGAGAPEPAWVGKWVKAYDPRKDSTYPGGSGSHRALDESTYEWTDNPGLHALTWALGRWSNGKRVCGIGAPVSTIRVADFVECANVCEANGWKVGGVEWTTDSKWDTLKRMLQAGGAVPTQTGAMIGCLVSTPRTAIATIEGRHLHDGLSIAASKSRRDRFNSVIPRYVDEDSDWAVVSGKVVSEPAYVTADGGARTKEIDFPLVQVFSGATATQPGQLAAYAIVNSREAGPFTWTTGPEWIGLKTGDVVYLNVPEEGLSNQPVLITRRSPDPSTGKVSFAGETETYSKHAYALGQSTTPPPPFSLSAPDLKPAAPVETAWSVAGTTSGEGFPALIVSGTSELPSADAIVIDYRLSGVSEWKNSAIVSAVEPVSHVIAPLESETAYDVRIGYRVSTIVGNFTIFSNVTTGLGKITEIEGSLSDIDAELAQLDADTAQALIDIAAAQATITSMQSDAAAMQAALTTAQGQITAQGADILANADDIATVQSTLNSQGASITTLQQTASDHTGQIATINSTLTTQGGSITTLQSSVTTLQGSVSTLSSTVSTQGASISAAQTAITALQGSMAALTVQVTASTPNLLPYGSFENGMTGWNVTGGTGWASTYGSYGSYLNNLTASTGAGTSHVTSDKFAVGASRPYVVTADSYFVTSGETSPSDARCRVELLWYDGAGAQIGGIVAGPWRNVDHTFSSDGAGHAALALATTSPAGAAWVAVRLANYTAYALPRTIGWRQVKFEEGSVWTAYTSEASSALSFTAISTLNGQYATLSSTVATHGSSITTNANAITTLQGNVATLDLQVKAGSSTNLIGNPGPTNGTAGWSNLSGSTLVVNNATGGDDKYFRLASSTLTRMWAQYEPVTMAAGATYALHADTSQSGAGATEYRLVIICQNSSNREVGRLYGAIMTAHGRDYSGNKRIESACIGVTPAGTAKGYAFFEVWGTGSGANSFDFLRVKLERSTFVTPYSYEAAVTQSFEALSTLTTQYASLSSTVSTQGVTITSQQTAITTINGNVTTLFGRWGVEIDVNGYISGITTNNNGSRSNFIIRADRFAITSSAGAGTAYPFEVISGVTYIKDAIIKDASIGTLKIAKAAIFDVSYDSGTGNAIGTAWVTVCSATRTRYDADSVFILTFGGVANLDADNTAATTMGISVEENGVSIWSAMVGRNDAGRPKPFFGQKIITPTAGAKTYTLRANRSNNTNTTATVSSGTITIMEAKKIL